MRPRISGWIVATVVFTLFIASLAIAHSGGLDANGGHRNRKAGGYHFHRGPLAGQSFASKAEALAALRASEGKERPVSIREGSGKWESANSHAKIDAVVDVLVRKGVVTRAELQEALRN